MSCMGGWCHLRDKCRHHAPNPHQPALERMCAADSFDSFHPWHKASEEAYEPTQTSVRAAVAQAAEDGDDDPIIRLVRPAGSWELKTGLPRHMAPANWMEALA